MSYLLTSSVALAVAAGLGVCTSPQRCERAEPSALQHVERPGLDAQRLGEVVRKVVDAATPSVVRIFYGEGDMLTGTIISADGLVLTCAHLPVPVGEAVTIGLWDGRRVAAKVLSKVPLEGEPRVGKDIALVQMLEAGAWKHAPVAEAAPVRSDEPLLALGFPDTMLLGADRSADPLYVRMGYEVLDPYQSRPEELFTSIRGTGGDSGGPLFDMSGRVVGVVHRGDLSGAHMAYTRIEVLRHHWDRLALGRGPLAAADPGPIGLGSLESPVEVASRVRGSVVEVHSGSRLVALGCVVGDGLVLTKASELGPNLTIVTANDHVGIAEVAATDHDLDLALLRLQYAPELTRGIEPIRWEAGPAVLAGTVVVMAPSNLLAPQIGVACFAAREVPGIAGFLPCEFEEGNDGIRVVRIVDELRRFRLRPLAQPLRVGDTLTHVEGVPVRDLATYRKMMFGGERIGEHPVVAGEPVRITFRRGDQAIEDVAGLEFSQSPSGQLVRPVSARYSGFRSAFATDLPARPEHCGAPVLDSDGRVLGMLMARAPFVEALVVPSDTLAPALERMMRALESAK